MAEALPWRLQGGRGGLLLLALGLALALALPPAAGEGEAPASSHSRAPRTAAPHPPPPPARGFHAALEALEGVGGAAVLPPPSDPLPSRRGFAPKGAAGQGLGLPLPHEGGACRQLWDERCVPPEPCPPPPPPCPPPGVAPGLAAAAGALAAVLAALGGWRCRGGRDVEYRAQARDALDMAALGREVGAALATAAAQCAPPPHPGAGEEGEGTGESPGESGSGKEKSAEGPGAEAGTQSKAKAPGEPEEVEAVDKAPGEPGGGEARAGEAGCGRGGGEGASAAVAEAVARAGALAGAAAAPGASTSWRAFWAGAASAAAAPVAQGAAGEGCAALGPVQGGGDGEGGVEREFSSWARFLMPGGLPVGAGGEMTTAESKSMVIDLMRLRLDFERLQHEKSAARQQGAALMEANAHRSESNKLLTAAGAREEEARVEARLATACASDFSTALVVMLLAMFAGATRHDNLASLLAVCSGGGGGGAPAAAAWGPAAPVAALAAFQAAAAHARLAFCTLQVAGRMLGSMALVLLAASAASRWRSGPGGGTAPLLLTGLLGGACGKAAVAAAGGCPGLFFALWWLQIAAHGGASVLGPGLASSLYGAGGAAAGAAGAAGAAARKDAWVRRAAFHAALAVALPAAVGGAPFLLRECGWPWAAL